ncbi:MAG: 1,2-phenylacetyl-CoA epoxidase subunit PaaC [Trueperaceae bacterium]
MTAADLKSEVSAALVERLTALADDELVLGHRNAEWTGHAPILEEDIAIANVAQDEIGHAVLWYGLVQELTGQDPDRLAFFRGANEYRSSALVELPRGDWAFTMLRQYLFDTYEAELLPRLMRSAYTPVSEVAAKVNREELFHLRHSALWVERLAFGTEESKSRLQSALNELWPLVPQLLAPLEGDALLAADGIYPDPAELAAAVLGRLRTELNRLELTLPALPAPPAAGARSDRGEGHLAALLAEMQSVARADPAAESW